MWYAKKRLKTVFLSLLHRWLPLKHPKRKQLLLMPKKIRWTDAHETLHYLKYCSHLISSHYLLSCHIYFYFQSHISEFNNVRVDYQTQAASSLENAFGSCCNWHPFLSISASVLFVTLFVNSKKNILFLRDQHLQYMCTNLCLLQFNFISLTASFFCCQIVPEGEPTSGNHYCEHIAHKEFLICMVDLAIQRKGIHFWYMAGFCSAISSKNANSFF